MVTKLRAKVSSDVVRSSGRRAGFQACSIERLSNPVSKSGSSSREAKVYTESSCGGEVSDSGANWAHNIDASSILRTFNSRRVFGSSQCAHRVTGLTAAQPSMRSRMN
jgi:hypothetical protein